VLHPYLCLSLTTALSFPPHPHAPLLLHADVSPTTYLSLARYLVQIDKATRDNYGGGKYIVWDGTSKPW